MWKNYENLVSLNFYATLDSLQLPQSSSGLISSAFFLNKKQPTILGKLRLFILIIYVCFVNNMKGGWFLRNSEPY